MKKLNHILFIYVIFTVCLFLIGCNENTKKDVSINQEVKDGREDNEMNDIDIYDFYFINKAPETKEKHSLDELIKIYFSAGSNQVAIDIKNNEIYVDPLWSTNGVDSFEDQVNLNEKEALLKILEEYDVQEWKADYTTKDPDSYQDGYGWLLLLQFEDGTVEKHRGSGPEKNKIIPENFENFVTELTGFVDERIEEN